MERADALQGQAADAFPEFQANRAATWTCVAAYRRPVADSRIIDHPLGKLGENGVLNDFFRRRLLTIRARADSRAIAIPEATSSMRVVCRHTAMTAAQWFFFGTFGVTPLIPALSAAFERHVPPCDYREKAV